MTDISWADMGGQLLDAHMKIAESGRARGDSIDTEDIMTDALVNLLHYCNSCYANFDISLKAARIQFDEETKEASND